MEVILPPGKERKETEIKRPDAKDGRGEISHQGRYD